MAYTARALVRVSGVDLPEPSTYEANTATIVDSARNVDGYVIGSVIRHDVAKVTLGWRWLSAQDWAAVTSLFTNQFYHSVDFYDQTRAAWITREMYCGDRSSGMFRRDPETGEVLGWTDCSLALVEV